MTNTLHRATAAALIALLTVGAAGPLAAAQAPEAAGLAVALAQAPIGDVPRPIPVPRPPRAEASADTAVSTECPAPRHIKRGAIIGAAIGAGAGAGFFLFLAALFDAFDDDDIGGSAYIVFGAVGLVAGGAGGAVVGAHAGGQVRRGRTTCPDAVGSLTLQGGGLDYLSRDDVDPGPLTRATLLTHWSAHVATGAEVARMAGTPGGWRLALATRIDPIDIEAPIQPYVAGSIGGNFWQESENLLSADIGGGVEWLLDDTWSLGVESRYHWNLQNAVEPGTYRFASLVGQARVRW